MAILQILDKMKNSDTPAESSVTPRMFDLQAEHELRFEIPQDCTSATLTLLRGSAEIFGIELALNRAYPLPPLTNAAAFTWHGASIKLAAPESALAYTATDTPMPSYISAHAALQSRRDIAKNNNGQGPRAVIVGPAQSGKTSLVSMLGAYAVKANGCVTVLDLDPSGSGAVPIVPQALAISVVSHLDYEVGGLVHDRLSSVMLGHYAPRDNMPVTINAFQTIGNILDRLMANPSNNPHVGCIVDTSGDIEGPDGPEWVAAAVKAVSADVVFVLGAERLFASIRKQLSELSTEVLLLSKSGGVVSREAASRMSMQSRLINTYFYGPDNKLSPFRTVIDFAQITVYKVGGAATVVPDSVLPVGAVSTLDPLKPSVVELSRDLLHSVLGVSQATKEDEVMTSPVFGYVHVVKVDVDRGTATVLAPSPGRIPSRFLLLGSLKWIE